MLSGTYQDVEAALAALTFNQEAAIEAADGEPTADQPVRICCVIDWPHADGAHLLMVRIC